MAERGCRSLSSLTEVAESIQRVAERFRKTGRILLGIGMPFTIRDEVSKLTHQSTVTKGGMKNRTEVTHTVACFERSQRYPAINCHGPDIPLLKSHSHTS